MEAREDIDSLLLYYKQTEQKLHVLLSYLNNQKENIMNIKRAPNLLNHRYYVNISYEMTKYSSNIVNIQNMLRLSVINNESTFSLGDKEYSCLFGFVWLFNVWTRGGLFWWAVNHEDAWSIGEDSKDISEIELHDIDSEPVSLRFSHSEIANHAKGIIREFFNSDLRNIYKAYATIERESILIRERYGIPQDSDFDALESINKQLIADTMPDTEIILENVRSADLRSYLSWLIATGKKNTKRNAEKFAASNDVSIKPESLQSRARRHLSK